MEKILLAIDGVNPCPNALDFSCYLGRLTNSKVTGVFLENFVADEQPVMNQTAGVPYLDWKIDKTSAEYKKKVEKIERNISLFKDSCIKNSIRYSVHKDDGAPAREIIKESRYADLVILDAKTSFDNKLEGTPSEFVKGVLKDSECPVVIAPGKFDGIDEIIFTYNGSKSSVFAIKQFCYLFPGLGDKKMTVLEIDDEGLCSAEEKGKFKEWMSGHYSSIGYTLLKGDVEKELSAYLLNRKNVIIVMGAYGRSMVSLFLKHSRADLLIKSITQAIFIAHP